MKKLKNMTAAKKLTAFAVTILVVFAGINLFWFISQGLLYYGYAGATDKKIDEYTGEVSYSKKIGQYGCLVSKASYLASDGFLSVGKPYGLEADENGCPIGDTGLNIALFIWPQPTGSYKYGLLINDYSRAVSFMQIYIDKDINYLPRDPQNTEYNHLAEELVKENDELIKEEMNLAKKLWGLEGKKDILIGLNLFINDITPKQVFLVLAVTAALFAMINLFWLFFSLLRFKNYAKKLEKVKKGKKIVHQKTVNGFLYAVQKPKYLRYGCLLTVSGESKNNNTAIDLTLHIRTGLRKSKEYTVFVAEKQNGSPECFPLTRDIEYDKKRNSRNEKEETASHCEELIDKYFTELKAMVYGAKELWEITL